MKAVSIATLAAISLMSLELMAKDSITANITILNSSKHAESQSNSVHSYLVKNTTSSNYTRMTGTGNFSGINQSTNDTRSVQVGVDVQGYSQIVLRGVGDRRLKLNTDSNLTASEDGLDMTIAYQLETDAIITKGSWQDYLEGREIEYQLTEESLKKEAKVSGKNISKSIEATLKKGLVAQGLSSINMESDVTLKPKNKSLHYCKATLRTLDCFNAKVEFEVYIRIKGL